MKQISRENLSLAFLAYRGIRYCSIPLSPEALLFSSIFLLGSFILFKDFIFLFYLIASYHILSNLPLSVGKRNLFLAICTLPLFITLLVACPYLPTDRPMDSAPLRPVVLALGPYFVNVTCFGKYWAEPRVSLTNLPENLRRF